MEGGNHHRSTPFEYLCAYTPTERLGSLAECADALALTDTVADRLEVGFGEPALVDDVENLRLGDT